ncbi:Fe-S cluster assembly protein SufD [Mobilicoccus caccae]|uniref:Fe-S cluster assembly protein SufD n=1 Tax=Mobilicoccus caccae TaxID=1859295 RepID=A0ABQ6INK4_9MICO|nr:Fe-S cluster assembly protein SufD [Mobilicoccus caccae]GMA39503.1 Fe-S cluster assembly protein SufD [Mobilicoccus caccae]
MPLVDRSPTRPADTTSTGVPVSVEDQPLLGTPAAEVSATDAVRRAVESTVPEQSRAEWRTSYNVADFAVPSGREEGWRFTPIKKLAGLLTDQATGARLDLQETLPAGVTTSTMSTQEWRALTPPEPADRIAALAAAHSGGVHVVDIPADTELTEPVILRLTGAGERVHGHLVVRVGTHATGTVILAHHGEAEYAELVTVLAGDGSQVSVVSVQEWAPGAIHVGQHDVVVGRDAQVRHVAVTLGGELVRVSTNAFYTGPGGKFEGLGVSFADAGQHLEHRLFVDHEPPHCTSDVLYKSALQGEGAHTVWVGDVLIRASAEGTETYELNRNLLLSDGARADSVPNLEIETGEIAGAGHASATGRFDDEQLFYLQARGIPESEARRLVVRGFFADIVERIGVAEVSDHLMEVIEAELGLVAVAE